jgi:DNA-binding winged helix-turn-helix (wHTH) protein/tetratricopeptide (TPR) repeat protein
MGSYTFGPYRLDVAGTTLYRDGQPVPLTPKVFDTLVALVSETGRTLTKDELIKRVWPDAAVGDGSLAQNILVLRKLLDAHFPGESPIATFPKRGYRFTAPVAFQPDTVTIEPQPVVPSTVETIPPKPHRPESPSRPWRMYLVIGTVALAVAGLFLLSRTGPQLSPVAKRRSIAVLAFRNLTTRPEVEWYSTALAETITGELNSGGDLRVISSDNVRRMQQELSLPGVIITKGQIHDIRSDLGCDLVLSGSYVTVGDKIRVELLLSDARTGDTITSVTETDDQNRLLELVSRTGQQLRSKLGIRPLQAAQSQTLQHSMSADDRANRFYFDGVAALKLRDGPEAQRQLSLAIETDPTFALAHAALSSTWHDLGYSSRALAEAKTALGLAGGTQSREDHLAAEAQYYECLFDWKKAGETYRSLWQFFPDNTEYGLKLVQIEYAAGRPVEALKVLSQLRSLSSPDSLDPRIDLLEAVGEQLSGDYQRAYEAASRAAQKAEKVKARILLAQARVKQGLITDRLGRPTEARQYFAEAKTLFLAVGDTRDAADALTLDAECLRAMGQIETAVKELETALAMSRKIGFTRLTNRILAAYSNLLLNLGSLDKARQACEEALASNTEINDVGTAFTVRMDRGGIAKAEGRYADARADFLESIRITTDAGYRLEAANATTNLGSLDAGLGRLPDARRELEEAIARKRELGNRGSLAASLGALALVLRAQSDLEGARRVTEEQCAILESLHQRSGLPACRMMRARLLLDAGHLQEARVEVVKVVTDSKPELFGPIDLARLALLQLDTGDQRGALDSVAGAQRKLPRPANTPDWSLPVALAAARVARSIPQLQKVAEQAEKLSLIPVMLEARLAMLPLSPPSSQSADAGRLAADASQKGFVLIGKQAASLSL